MFVCVCVWEALIIKTHVANKPANALDKQSRDRPRVQLNPIDWPPNQPARRSSSSDTNDTIRPWTNCGAIQVDVSASVSRGHCTMLITDSAGKCVCSGHVEMAAKK